MCKPLFCQHIIFKMRFLIIITSCLLLAISTKGQIKNQINWQQNVDYLIDVELDDVNHYINGEIAITYTNNSPDALSFIYFHIWPNAYKNRSTAFAKQMEQNGELDFYYSSADEKGYIDSLSFSSNGEALRIEKTPDIDIIKVLLSKPLNEGEKVTLFSPFRVKIPKVFSRLGHENQDYFMTQWYPKPAVYDVNGWNPMPYLNHGEFYSEFGTFKVSITLPDNYVIAATGECQTRSELEGDFKPGTGDSLPQSSNIKKTVIFTASNVHDFAWFASKRFGYVSKEISVEDRKVVARIVSSEPNSKYLGAVEKAITYYSEHVGAYPYSHASVVHGELKAGGGMEYPMITLCDFLNDEVIVHEVGHNWFYGILANNERVYPWMDESINSYYEAGALESGSKGGLNNNSIMKALIKDNLLSNKHQAIGLHSKEYTSMNYGVSVYGAGALSFNHLKAYLGDEMFKKCMNTYYNEWKFKHPLPDDMKHSFERTSSKDLIWFFDGIINADGVFDYAIKAKGDSLFLKNKGDVTAPMPVTIVKEGRPSTVWVTVPVGEQKFVGLNNDWDKAISDAELNTLDLYANNDVKPSAIKLKIVTGQDKKGEKEVYVLPTYGWNVYDKSMLGLSLHNYSFSNKALAWNVSPMYSFHKKSINGNAEINYTIPLDSIEQYLEIGVKARAFNFEEGGLSNGSYKYTKVSPSLTYHFPKSSHRSKITKELTLRYDHILLNPTFHFNDDTLRGPSTFRSKSRSFATATYKLQNKRSINGYSFELMAEYGKISNKVILGDLNDKRVRTIYVDTINNTQDTIFFFPKIGEDVDDNDFIKLSAIWKYNLDIGIKNKPMEFRVFGSYLIKEYANTIYKNSVGSQNRAGYYDYRFDDYLMHRNADYGLFQNQISSRRDFSKFVGPIASSDKWLISANVTVPLPGKFPIKPYLEILTFNDIKDIGLQETQSVGFFYNVGLEFEVIPNRFEIFINLAQSEQVTDIQENGYSYIDNFVERITFVLDLNDLVLPKLKRNIKVF
jgi:hypothetical protein